MTEAFVDSVVFCSLGIFLVLTKGSWLLFSFNHCDILTPIRLFCLCSLFIIIITYSFILVGYFLLCLAF